MLKKGLAWHYIDYDKRIVLAKVKISKACVVVYTLPFTRSLLIVYLM